MKQKRIAASLRRIQRQAEKHQLVTLARIRREALKKALHATPDNCMDLLSFLTKQK